MIAHLFKYTYLGAHMVFLLDFFSSIPHLCRISKARSKWRNQVLDWIYFKQEQKKMKSNMNIRNGFQICFFFSSLSYIWSGICFKCCTICIMFHWSECQCSRSSSERVCIFICCSFLDLLCPINSMNGTL